jgi:hypothetical protein
MPVKKPPHRGQTAGKKKSFTKKSKCLIKLIPLIRREYAGRFSEQVIFHKGFISIDNQHKMENNWLYIGCFLVENS